MSQLLLHIRLLRLIDHQLCLQLLHFQVVRVGAVLEMVVHLPPFGRFMVSEGVLVDAHEVDLLPDLADVGLQVADFELEGDHVVLLVEEVVFEPGEFVLDEVLDVVNGLVVEVDFLVEGLDDVDVLLEGVFHLGGSVHDEPGFLVVGGVGGEGVGNGLFGDVDSFQNSIVDEPLNVCYLVHD